MGVSKKGTDSVQAGVGEWMREGGGSSRPKDEDVRKAMTYPKFLPANGRIIWMDNGLLFVVTDILHNASTGDLFDRRGVHIGRFVTDVPAATLVLRKGKAYGVAEIDDYEYVKRFAYTVWKY